MFLEQFAHFGLHKRYIVEMLLIHFIHITYLQSKQTLDTNVQNCIVISNKRYAGGKNENSSDICKVFKR